MIISINSEWQKPHPARPFTPVEATLAGLRFTRSSSGDDRWLAPQYSWDETIKAPRPSDDHIALGMSGISSLTPPGCRVSCLLKQF